MQNTPLSNCSEGYRNIICPVCHSSNTKRQYQYEGFSFNICRKCTLAFVFPQEKGVGEEVGNASSSPTETGFLRNLLESTPERAKKAKILAKNRAIEYKTYLGRKPKNICEIGAADGVFAEGFTPLGIDYLGLDVNEKLVERACSLGRDVILAEAKDIKEKGKFDVVFFSQVLEHVLEPNEFLSSIHEILVEGGIVHIDVPNHNGLIPNIIAHPISLDTE